MGSSGQGLRSPFDMESPDLRNSLHQNGESAILDSERCPTPKKINAVHFQVLSTNHSGSKKFPTRIILANTPPLCNLRLFPTHPAFVGSNTILSLAKNCSNLSCGRIMHRERRMQTIQPKVLVHSNPTLREVRVPVWCPTTHVHAN